MTLLDLTGQARARYSSRATQTFGALLAAAGGAGMIGLAVADAHAPATVSTGQVAALGKSVVVDSRALTVYELRPETTRHLLCKKANGCFAVWPPVTVANSHVKVTAAHGVPGKLRILHRDGIFQLTLGGHPLYRFAGDASKRGVAHGDGLRSFGGTWHVVTVATAKTSPPAMNPGSTSTPSGTTTPGTPTVPTTTTTTTSTPTVTTPPYYPPYNY